MSIALLDSHSKTKEFSLNKGIRWSLMTIFTLLYIVLMFNVGIFNAATSQIKKDFKLNDTEFGLLGTFNGGGRIIGTLIFMLIINKYNRKFILIIPLFINSLSIYLFTITENKKLLNIERGINGICQVFGFIYFPIWIDQFGIQKKKTLMMTFIQLAAPLGMVSGYLINNIIGSKNWRQGFYIEFICELILLFILLFYPKTYFAKNVFFKYQIEKPSLNKDSLLNNKRSTSIFYIPNKNKNQENNSFCFNIFLILSNKIFICSVLYKSTTQFICSGIGFWLTDFLEKQLNVKDNLSKIISYIIVIIGGPCLGLFLGGFLGSLTGGYEKKKSVLLIFFLQLIASVVGSLIYFSKNVKNFNLIMCIFFIFNSAVIPVNTGLILWSIPKELKGLGNGINSLITTFLGKFPAPYIYGLIQQNFYYINNKIGMLFLMGIAYIGVLFLFLAFIFRNYSKENRNNQIFSKRDNKDSFVERMRNSINQQVVSSAFNNIGVNDSIETDNGYMGDKESAKTYEIELKEDD